MAIQGKSLKFNVSSLKPAGADQSEKSINIKLKTPGIGLVSIM